MEDSKTDVNNKNGNIKEEFLRTLLLENKQVLTAREVREVLDDMKKKGFVNIFVVEIGEFESDVVLNTEDAKLFAAEYAKRLIGDKVVVSLKQLRGIIDYVVNTIYLTEINTVDDLENKKDDLLREVIKAMNL